MIPVRVNWILATALCCAAVGALARSQDSPPRTVHVL